MFPSLFEEPTFSLIPNCWHVCTICGFHNGDDEKASILGYDAMLIGK
jgi:hypothetical protein